MEITHFFHVVDEKCGHAGGVEEEDGHDVDERVALDRPLLRPRVHSQVANRRPENDNRATLKDVAQEMVGN